MKQPLNAIKITQNFNFNCWQHTLALAVVFFSPFIFNFLWGNHDWQWIKEYTPLWSGVFEGRFSQFILQTILFNGTILPVITLVTGLAFYAAAAIILLNLWRTPRKSWVYIVLSLCLITSPHTLSWLYFAFITLSSLSWPFFVIAGFWLLEDVKSKPYFTVRLIGASMLFLAALGGYPPVVNLIGVIFCTLVILSLTFQKQTVKTIIKKYLPHVAAILFSITMLVIIQHGLKKYNLQFGTYNTAGLNLSELNAKIILTAKAAIEQFFISLSFINFPYKSICFLLFLLALWELYAQLPKLLTSILLFAMSVVGMVLSPLITLFLAANTTYVLNEPRIAFFGLTYVYIFSAAVLLRSSSTFVRNISTIFIFAVLLYNFHTIAYAAKVWLCGFKAEANFAERFLTRIEEKPSFSPLQKYTFIQGGNLDFRSRYYIPDNTKIDSYTLSAPYIPWHLPSKAYHFYYPVNFITNDFDTFWSYIDPSQVNLTIELKKYVLNQAEPWPNPNAVFQSNGTIVLTLTPEGKLAAQNWMEFMWHNYPH